ncbi:MerR family transcriptional regulator [Halopseudomonas sp.]|uniref:MerR family transcriptional regulator n=1 Tax=Halopseudomonas sp. TaxID=2901191 RepID=UPI00300217FE
MTQTYSISDLARELDITTRAIRFYEEQNMLSPERRGLERVYSAKDKVTLKLILRGKRIGFSLAECKELIELYDPSHGNRKQLETFMEKIAQRRAQLAQQLLDIEQMQIELDTAEERCRTALAQTL